MRSWVYLDQVTDDSPQSPARFTSHLRKSRRVQSSRQYRVASQLQHQRWLTLSNWRRLYCFAPRGLSFPTLGWNYNFFNLGGSTRSYRRFAMSFGVTSENVFLSALQPNLTVSTYAVPSETELSYGGSYAKEEAKFKRLHQQVSMRMAEKSTLPRQNGSSSQYAASGVFLCAVISL